MRAESKWGLQSEVSEGLLAGSRSGDGPRATTIRTLPFWGPPPQGQRYHPGRLGLRYLYGEHCPSLPPGVHVLEIPIHTSAQKCTLGKHSCGRYTIPGATSSPPLEALYLNQPETRLH
jgi:hypothetical protein